MEQRVMRLGGLDERVAEDNSPLWRVLFCECAGLVSGAVAGEWTHGGEAI